MPISSLRISQFRNLEGVDICPRQEGLNIIRGENGSGKTSLLEAIYYLGTGRSFRTSIANALIRQDHDKFSVFSQIVSQDQRYIPIGVERDLSGASRIRMNDSDLVSLADLATCLPLRLIHSQSHQLFESGPSHRRKYLDWGLFYHYPGFLLCWRQYERVLKQRNAVLALRRPKRELDPWTDELVKLGNELNDYRKNYVDVLQVELIAISEELLPEWCVELSYLPGWKEDVASLNDSFAACYHDEMRLGSTKIGPHRAELEIKVNGIPAKQFLSRGQQKLLICAMIIAQGKLKAKQTKQGLIYLIDDLPCELDSHSRHRLLSLLLTQQVQVFITAIDLADGPDSELSNLSIPMKVFHVEHGRVAELEHLGA
jgi:DNA replication and repair protein RecF